ncbi:MAG: transketolase [Acidobacteria bacterium]|nr:transketolase [Acidobacteriota bacterium]
MDRAKLIPVLHNIATRLRIDSIRSTSEAGSGHPTTCCSAAEIVAALFFAEMRFDPQHPRDPHNDRFVLSKGHAAPILYSAWAEAGAFDRSELLKLRHIDSDLEGHPTPRLPFVDVATGSLGQGLCAGLGLALNARRIGSSYRTYVLMGDGESTEGSVWEAAELADFYALDNLCAITDVNRLGQSRPTLWQHDMEAFAMRWRAFGWQALVVDGHDLNHLLIAFENARQTRGRPSIILARTLKGRGVSFLENLDGWHGKPLKQGDELSRAIAELEAQLDRRALDVSGAQLVRKPEGVRAEAGPGRLEGRSQQEPQAMPPPAYKIGDKVATREAYGEALVKLGARDPRIVVLDADVKNSTFSEKFEKAFGDRFYQCFITEQAMLGMAMGFASRGAIPFPWTFACFLTRAADFIRMTAISRLDVKLCGSHAGLSIGEDGPSQMGLEDLALARAQPNFTVLYPCDGVSAERLVEAAIHRRGPVYIRTSRPKTRVIYAADETFEVGGSKVLSESRSDVATVVAAGITVYEALAASDDLRTRGVSIRIIDAYSVQPVDRATLRRAAAETAGRIITVEDHYAAGGLGDAVAEALAADGVTVTRLGVREIPRSGKPEELLDRFGISARHIVETVLRIVPQAATRKTSVQG